MSIKDINDKLMKAGFIPSIISETTKTELEEMYTDSIIEMWEGQRLLVQRVTKHSNIMKLNDGTVHETTCGYMWLSCIDLNTCERVRLKCKYKRRPVKYDHDSLQTFCDKSIWKIGTQRLYMKYWQKEGGI